MLKVIATGCVQHVGEEWGVMFGPLSDVDAEIPGSGGHTLRTLKDAGQIPADVFEEVNDPAKPEAHELPADEPEEEGQ